MSNHQPVHADRIRRIPGQFSWVDHRLVREHRMDGCSHGALALYLFLVTVSDARGISYYGDANLMKRLSMDENTLISCRNELIRTKLVAYRKPVSQVLPLDVPRPAPPSRRSEKRGAVPESLREIFARVAGGGS